MSPLGQGPSSLEETPQGCLCAPAVCTHWGPSVTSPQEEPHSLCVSVLEAPDLHGSHQEVLRAERLVVEGVTVARAATVQVPVDEECLAAPSTCRRHQSGGTPTHIVPNPTVLGCAPAHPPHQ